MNRDAKGRFVKKHTANQELKERTKRAFKTVQDMRDELETKQPGALTDIFWTGSCVEGMFEELLKTPPVFNKCPSWATPEETTDLEKIKVIISKPLKEEK